MTDKKKLMINCNLCDAREFKSESYSAYEEIMLNADIVLVSKKSKEIFNALPITCNVDETIDVDENAKFNVQSINGSCDITPATDVPENAILSVNGCLNIYPGAEETLKKYFRIFVNGAVKCPKSLENILASFSVNGSVEVYPDDCTVLDEHFVIDKYFPLRAKEGGKYYAAYDVVTADENVDIKTLAEKNVQFVTKTLVVYEPMIESSIQLVDETTELIVIPSDFKLVCGNTNLNSEIIKKYSDKLFVYGNLTVNAESETALNEMNKLKVTGDINVISKLEKQVRKLNADYKNLKVIKGREIGNKVSVTVDSTLVSKSEDGINVKNVGCVKVSEDISPEIIFAQLSFENCGQVICSEQQRSAVEAVGINIASTSTDSMEKADNLISAVLDSKMINAEKYVM